MHYNIWRIKTSHATLENINGIMCQSEFTSRKVTCGLGHYHGITGEGIREHYQCDGILSCHDVNDEAQCGMIRMTDDGMPQGSQFCIMNCLTHKCQSCSLYFRNVQVVASHSCRTLNNCNDGSDEINCIDIPPFKPP